VKKLLVLALVALLPAVLAVPAWAGTWPPTAEVRPGAAEIGFYAEGCWHYQKISRPVEIRDGHMYVPLDAVCMIMDTSVGFAGNDCLVLTPAAKKSVYLYVFASPETVEKIHKGSIQDCPLMVPLRGFCEAAGYRVTWDGEKVVVANIAS